VLASFLYDGLGRRIQATESGTTTDFYFSKDWRELEEDVGGTTLLSLMRNRTFLRGISPLEILAIILAWPTCILPIGNVRSARNLRIAVLGGKSSTSILTSAGVDDFSLARDQATDSQ